MYNDLKYYIAYLNIIRGEKQLKMYTIPILKQVFNT